MARRNANVAAAPHGATGGSGGGGGTSGTPAPAAISSMDSTTTQLMPVRSYPRGQSASLAVHVAPTTDQTSAQAPAQSQVHQQQQQPPQQQQHLIGKTIASQPASRARRHRAEVHTTTIYSRVCVVDLAGSDNRPRPGEEGRSINRGCLAVGRVVLALAEGATHVPYRDYPLTSLLAAILGSTNTTYAMMLTCVSPSEQHAVDTRTTLEYASKGAVIDARERQEYQRIHGSADSTDALQQAAVGMAAARKAAGAFKLTGGAPGDSNDAAAERDATAPAASGKATPRVSENEHEVPWSLQMIRRHWQLGRKADEQGGVMANDSSDPREDFVNAQSSSRPGTATYSVAHVGTQGCR